MKRIALWVTVLAIALANTTAASNAQETTPSPSPDPLTYTDAAMSYTAPADAYLIGRRVATPEQLTSELQPVAIWIIHPGREDQRSIQISMESFIGAPNQWPGQFESQMHSGGEGVLIRDRTPMSLLNGMPAMFVEIATGSGFTSRKQFAVVWADGQRGIVLSESTRLGDVTAEQAKEALKNVTAVRYPADRE